MNLRTVNPIFIVSTVLMALGVASVVVSVWIKDIVIYTVAVAVTFTGLIGVLTSEIKTVKPRRKPRHAFTDPQNTPRFLPMPTAEQEAEKYRRRRWWG